MRFRQIGEGERHHDRGEGLLEFVELALGRNREVDHAELGLLQHLARIAELIGRENLNLDRTVGAFFDIRRELHRGLMRRMRRVGVMSEFQGGLCECRNCRSNQDGSGQ